MRGLGRRPASFAVAGLVGLSLMAGCGSGSPESEMPVSAVPEALKLQAERYGYTDEFTRCVSRTSISNASQLSGSSGAGKLRREATSTCKARPGMTVLLAAPTRGQVDSYLATNEQLIVSQNSGKGVSRQAAECLFNQVRDRLTPAQIATLVNGSGPGVHSVIARFRHFQARCHTG